MEQIGSPMIIGRVNVIEGMAKILGSIDGMRLLIHDDCRRFKVVVYSLVAHNFTNETAA